ncbi:hypothetical protein ACHAXT_012389 [Thalassiosira profunda]
MVCCKCCQGYATLCRAFTYCWLIAATVLAWLAVASCEFVTRDQVRLGMFRGQLTEFGECSAYRDNDNWNSGWLFVWAQVCAFLGPIIGTFTILLMIVDCCCDVCCSKYMQTFFVCCCSLNQAFTFLFYASDACLTRKGGEIDAAFYRGCRMGDGSIYSLSAWCLFFIGGFFLCCSPKPDPMCCKKDEEKKGCCGKDKDKDEEKRSAKEEDKDPEVVPVAAVVKEEEKAEDPDAEPAGEEAPADEEAPEESTHADDEPAADEAPVEEEEKAPAVVPVPVPVPVEARATTPNPEDLSMEVDEEEGAEFGMSMVGPPPIPIKLRISGDMKRRIAPRLVALAAAASLISAPSEATLLDDHGLTIKPALARELHALAHGEFAPAHPDVVDRRLQPGGVLARERASPTAHTSTHAPKVEECSSPLVEWTTRRVREMGAAAYRELFESKVPQMAYVYKHYVDRTHEDEYFVDEAQTAELNKRHADTVRFWREADVDNSIMTDDVLLLSMHGEDLRDNAKLVPTLEKMFDFQHMSDVLAFAGKVQGMIEALPMGYNNPLLTMNAVATRSTHNHGSFGGHSNPDRRIKDSVIVGDGVLQFLYDSGLHASGPDFVYAHEFGHHLQFQMDMAVPAGARYTHDDRRKELMADALAGYFLAHDDGGDFDAEAIGIFDRTAFATGDCSTGRDDHHGTPEQRRCASLWGASRAAEDDAPVLDPEEFVQSFNGAYLGILGLEAGACTLILEEASADEPLEAEIPSFTVAEESPEYEPEQAAEESQEYELGALAFQEEGNDGEETSGDAIGIADWLDAVQQQNDLKSSEDWSEEDEAGAMRHEDSG